MLFTQNDAAHSLFDIDALGGVAPGGENIASPLARLSDNASVSIDVVALRRARLVLGWVTVRWYTNSVFNQATQVYSAWPSLRG